MVTISPLPSFTQYLFHRAATQRANALNIQPEEVSSSEQLAIWEKVRRIGVALIQQNQHYISPSFVASQDMGHQEIDLRWRQIRLKKDQNLIGAFFTFEKNLADRETVQWKQADQASKYRIPFQMRTESPFLNPSLPIAEQLDWQEGRPYFNCAPEPCLLLDRLIPLVNNSAPLLIRYLEQQSKESLAQEQGPRLSEQTLAWEQATQESAALIRAWIQQHPEAEQLPPDFWEALPLPSGQRVPVEYTHFKHIPPSFLSRLLERSLEQPDLLSLLLKRGHLNSIDWSDRTLLSDELIHALLEKAAGMQKEDLVKKIVSANRPLHPQILGKILKEAISTHRRKLVEWLIATRRPMNLGWMIWPEQEASEITLLRIQSYFSGVDPDVTPIRLLHAVYYFCEAKNRKALEVIFQGPYRPAQKDLENILYKLGQCELWDVVALILRKKPPLSPPFISFLMQKLPATNQTDFACLILDLPMSDEFFSELLDKALMYHDIPIVRAGLKTKRTLTSSLIQTILQNGFWIEPELIRLTLARTEFMDPQVLGASLFSAMLSHSNNAFLSAEHLIKCKKPISHLERKLLLCWQLNKKELADLILQHRKTELDAETLLNQSIKSKNRHYVQRLIDHQLLTPELEKKALDFLETKED